MRRTRYAALLVLTLALLLCGAGTATADTSTEFDLQGFTSMVVDGANSHVFVSGSGQASSVAVFDLSGGFIKQIAGGGDAGGMVIAGSTLYVAHCTDSATSSIEAIDLATLTTTSTVNIAAGIASYPCQLGYAGGRVWFTAPGADGILGSMSTAAGHAVVTYPSIPCCYRFGEYSASRPDQLVAVELTQYGYVNVYDVSGGTPSKTATLDTFPEDIAVSADGASVYLGAAYSQDDVHQYAIPAFSESATYGAGQLNGVGGIAVSSSGRIAVFASGGLAILSAANTPPNRIFSISNAQTLGTAFSPDGSKVFAYGYDYDTQKATFNVLTNLAAIQSTLTSNTAAGENWVDDNLLFNGSLQRLDGSSAGGQTVKLYGSLDGAAFSVLKTTTTASDGSFTFNDAPSQSGDWVFETRYAGDSTHLAATSDQSYVHVARHASTLTLTAPDPNGSSHPGESITVAGDLLDYNGQPIAGATVHLADHSVDPYNPTPLVDVATDANGHFSVDEVPRNDGWWTVVATYDGDRVNDVATTQVTHWVGLDASGISLKSSASSVVFGHTVTLTAHLAAHHTNSTLTITRIVNGVSDVVASGPVDADGNLKLALSIGRTTTFRVDYAGDDWTTPGSATIKVLALPIITGVLSKPAARSGVYNLYHYSLTCVHYHLRGCPLFSVHVSPNQKGRNVVMVIQVKTRSGWKSVVSYRRTLGSLSRATFPIAYLSTGVIGKYYRIIALTPLHPDMGPVAYGYWHFRIIR